MEAEYIVKEPHNNRLLLIYSGWSAGISPFLGIKPKGWDVAVVHDYSEFADFHITGKLPETVKIPDRYAGVHLIAWSLGVVAAEITAQAARITSATAVNGTLYPCDDKCGIPTAIFLGTAEGLNMRNLTKFRKRLAGTAETFRKYFDSEQTDAEIENLQRQLLGFAKLSIENPSLLWRSVFLSKEDRIFPYENMVRCWSKVPEVIRIETDGAHFIPMQDVVSTVIPDKEEIARRFSSASGTYDSHALAQKEIALRLNEILSGIDTSTGAEVLEIGAGTGLFTKHYAETLKPRSIDYVDIAVTPSFSSVQEERRFIADAESWIEQCDKKYDMILSSSAIQWFSDLPAFFRKAASILKDGGIICLSSFVAGNLRELDAARRSPIRYFTADEFRGMAERHFEILHLSHECIRVDFDSHRDMLMHIKRTGTAGNRKSESLPLSALRKVKSLTYTPVYIVGKKR